MSRLNSLTARQSLNAQRDFSTARSHLLNTETELRQLEQENESAAAANEKESRTVSRDWVTRNGRKSEKEQMLHELQEECVNFSSLPLSPSPLREWAFHDMSASLPSVLMQNQDAASRTSSCCSSLGSKRLGP